MTTIWAWNGFIANCNQLMSASLASKTSNSHVMGSMCDVFWLITILYSIRSHQSWNVCLLKFYDFALSQNRANIVELIERTFSKHWLITMRIFCCCCCCVCLLKPKQNWNGFCLFVFCVCISAYFFLAILQKIKIASYILCSQFVCTCWLFFFFFFWCDLVQYFFPWYLFRYQIKVKQKKQTNQTKKKCRKSSKSDEEFGIGVVCWNATLW